MQEGELSVQNKILYHGSDKKIPILKPRQPTDTKKENSVKAIYATDSKNMALGMALTNQEGSESFATKKPFKINFVKGEPKMKFVYLHILSKKDFKKNAPGQYLSTKSVKPLKIVRYPVHALRNLWRKSNKRELIKFLKTRK